MSLHSDPLTEFQINNPDFLHALGRFYEVWSNIDIYIDVSVKEFLRLSEDEAHLLTASMEFGRKIRLLRGVVARSDRPHKDRIIHSLNYFQNDSKRNVIAHGYLADSDDHQRVLFIERNPHGKFTATELEFTVDGFKSHVDQLIVHHRAFIQALNIPFSEVHSFVNAAMSLSKRS